MVYTTELIQSSMKVCRLTFVEHLAKLDFWKFISRRIFLEERFKNRCKYNQFYFNHILYRYMLYIRLLLFMIITHVERLPAIARSNRTSGM